MCKSADIPCAPHADELAAAACGLIHELHFAPPVLQALHPLLCEPVMAELLPFCVLMTDARQAGAVLRWLQSEPSCWRQLAACAGAACMARERCRRLGIPPHVFLDTMGCFPRFLRETFQRTGRWQFDRAFWTWRQTSCRLFRLGPLEFEYCRADTPIDRLLCAGAPVLKVHIPSDADLHSPALKASYGQAMALFSIPELCPHGAPQAILCRSWLLSPKIVSCLGTRSGIRRFAQDYRLCAFDPQDDSFYEWLFNGERALERLPARTSLQRHVRALLAQASPVGSALGIYTGGLGSKE